MEKDNRNAYSEVIEILKLIDDEKRLEALPMEMLQILKSKANPDYKPQISSEIPLDEQNLQPETLSILSWIAMKYWGDEIENKANEENIGQEIKDNTNTEEIKDDPNIETDKEVNIETAEIPQNNMFDSQEQDNKKDIKQEPANIEQQNTNLPILHKDLKWYQKIKVKILEFFHKIFRKDHNEKKIDEK